MKKVATLKQNCDFPIFPFLTKLSIFTKVSKYKVKHPSFQSSISREQLNAVTSYIDASTVYGSDPELQASLRDPQNPAFLLVNSDYRDTNNLAFLPFTTDRCVQEINSTEPEVPCFKAGDGRAPGRVLKLQKTVSF